MRVIERRALLVLAWLTICLGTSVPRAEAGGDAPSWMHALVGVSLPAYDEKTNAVLLYSETNVTVLSADKIRTHVREAYKILRPEGRERGVLDIHFNPGRKITSLHGWCIPAQGKDYEVKDKDALDVSAPIEGGELVSDVKYRVLRIPAPDPGTSLAMSMKSKNNLSGCRTFGIFREPIQCERVIFLYNSLLAGFSRRHGYLIQR